MKNTKDTNAPAKKDILDELLAKLSPLETKKIDIKLGIAVKIIHAMKSKGWKHRELMDALQISSPSVISKYLSGTHNFTVHTLVEIGQVLDINLFDLSQDKKEPHKPASPVVSAIYQHGLIIDASPISLKADLAGKLQHVVDEYCI